jgi:predicted DCC family thiol-disulfide oxidoreductase YuxK
MQTTVFPLTLYYESACALCDSEMRNLMLRNHAGLLRFVDVSAPDFDTPPPGCQMQDLLDTIHAQCADGSVIHGVDVFRHAYTAVGLPGISRALSLPLLRPLSDALYPWVARHRHQFPRWISHLVFGRALRRAAERAAQRSHCTDATCSR